MKKKSQLLKIIAFVIVMAISSRINAQIHPAKDPITIEYYTYDKMDNPSNLKIEYCAYYDKTKKIFINAPDCNWSNTTMSEFLALIDGASGKPIKVRINGGVFEVTSNEWRTIAKENFVKFQGWDGRSYKIVVSYFLN